MTLNGVPLPTSEACLVPDDPLDEIFLPGSHRELMKQRVTDVPLMMGFCGVEGLLVDVVSQAASNRAVPDVFGNYDAHLDLALPLELRKVYPDGSRKQRDALKVIRDSYFQGGAISEATRNGFYNVRTNLILN